MGTTAALTITRAHAPNSSFYAIVTEMRPEALAQWPPPRLLSPPSVVRGLRRLHAAPGYAAGLREDPAPGIVVSPRGRRRSGEASATRRIARAKWPGSIPIKPW
jgi:hypothetical protein